MSARLRPFVLLGLCAWPQLVRGSEPASSGVGAPAPAAARPASDPRLLATVMRRLARVRQSRALFTEEKTLAALRMPLRSSGRLAYRRPDWLEKVTEWPREDVLSVRAGRLSLTTGGATRTIDLAAEPAIGALVEAILGTLAGDLPGLRRWYHVAATGTPADWRLTLRPRAAALAHFVGEIAIAGTGPRLTRLRMVEANGDTSVMTISPAG